MVLPETWSPRLRPWLPPWQFDILVSCFASVSLIVILLTFCGIALITASFIYSFLFFLLPSSQYHLLCSHTKSDINIYGNVLNLGLLTSPCCSQYIIVSSFLKAPPLTLFDYKYPDWSITVGYIIGFSSFMWIPIYMVYKLVWTPGSLKQVSGRKSETENWKTSHFLRHLLL